MPLLVCPAYIVAVCDSDTQKHHKNIIKRLQKHYFLITSARFHPIIELCHLRWQGKNQMIDKPIQTREVAVSLVGVIATRARRCILSSGCSVVTSLQTSSNWAGVPANTSICSQETVAIRSKGRLKPAASQIRSKSLASKGSLIEAWYGGSKEV